MPHAAAGIVPAPMPWSAPLLGARVQPGAAGLDAALSRKSMVVFW